MPLLWRDRDGNGEGLFLRKPYLSIWKDNRFFAQIGQSVNKSVVEALIRDGAAKLKGLRSKKTGRRYDATLKMMCGEQGVPRFQMEFETSARKG